ncbi:TolC family protein [Vibrio diazotrophicus]|nr:TolC family protein [Vibrio diazotrophicus]
MQQCLLALSISAAVLTTTPLYAGEPLVNEQTADSVASTSEKTLSQLIEAALSNDGTRRQYYAEAQAMRETGKASATQMDPKLKFGVTGLPTDSFAFDEDPMTNISVGLMQQFNRGDTSDLNDRKASLQAGGLEVKVSVRELEVANAITQIWLELGYQQVANKVLLENRSLLTELESFIQTNYSIGKSEAQDLINAQLQVAKLDEKIQANEQMQQRLKAQLSEWLGSDWLINTDQLEASNQLDWRALQNIENTASNSNFYSQLNQNPAVRMVDSSIDARRTQVDIARESYAPQFGVEVMYAYRQSNNMRGEPASDLVSAYITMDIPLFTGNKQDKNLAAAQYQVGAAQSQKDTLLKQMNAKVNALLVDKNNLTQRLERFESTLLPQADSRVKATERGYQNNTAQFNDVILATRDELALKLEYQRLITDLNLVNNNLSALLNSYSYQVDKPEITTTSEQQ